MTPVTHVPVASPLSVPTTLAPSTPRAEPAKPPHVWSEAECQDVMRRLDRVTQGGGVTTLWVWSAWIGYVRWARNRVTATGEMRVDTVAVNRMINRAKGSLVFTNDVTDAGLEAAAQHAERVAARIPDGDAPGASEDAIRRFPDEPAERSAFFSEATSRLDAPARAGAARRLAQLAEAKGLLSAGYAEISAHAIALLTNVGHVRYYPYTQARFSVTVRDPHGTGSGWAGDSHWDWGALGPERLTQVALDKCLTSQHPVRVEPGRYTTILEPQAASALAVLLPMVVRYKLPGMRVIDERLTASTDPMDPALGYPPFNTASLFDSFSAVLVDIDVYHPVQWITNGVVRQRAHRRGWPLYGPDFFGVRQASPRKLPATGLPNPGAIRLSVSGATQTVDEMVASTKRGLLVTRFDQVQVLDDLSTLCRGYTRDGVWLVEDGKIAKPVKNFVFTESVAGALNRVEQLGAPTRTFQPVKRTLGRLPQPVIAPAMKIRDFSFTALTDAV